MVAADRRGQFRGGNPGDQALGGRNIPGACGLDAGRELCTTGERDLGRGGRLCGPAWFDILVLWPSRQESRSERRNDRGIPENFQAWRPEPRFLRDLE